MNLKEKEDLTNFVNNFTVEILRNYKSIKDFNYIRGRRSELLEDSGLDLANINESDVVSVLKLSNYKHFFDDIGFENAAKSIFLNRVGENDIQSCIDNMIVGINEKNYLKKIYHYQDFYKDNYNIEINAIEKYFVKCVGANLFELKSNFATFIENYYMTQEGRQFIDSYKNKTDAEGHLPSIFYETLIDEMRKASIIDFITKDIKTNAHYFKPGGAGGLDGAFVFFDKDYHVMVNISTTESLDVSIENTSVLRHALTSKMLSEAIKEGLEKEAIALGRFIEYKHDDTDLRRECAMLWEENSKKGNKDIWLGNMVKDYISKHGLEKNDSDPSRNLDNRSKNNHIDTVVRHLNQLEPMEFINKVMGTTGEVSENTMKDFFNLANNFKTYFLSDLNDVRATKKLEKSELGKSLDDDDLTIFDIKTYLQTATLKNIALIDLNDKISKEAIELFYSYIITRRVFANINQNEINDPDFMKKTEKLILNEFLLKDDATIIKNKETLNEHDRAGLSHYIHYILFENTDTGALNLNNETASSLKKRLVTLGIDVEPSVIIDKIDRLYGDHAKIASQSLKKIQAAVDGRIAAEQEKEKALEFASQETKRADSEKERADSLAEELAKLRAELSGSKSTSKKNSQISDNGCDYSDQLSLVDDTEKLSSNKSTQINKNLSTFKRKPE